MSAVGPNYAGFKRTVGDASNPALALVVDETSKALHMTVPSDVETDWNVSADSHASLYIHSNTTPATDYLKLYHDATNGYVDAVGGNLVLAVSGTAEVTITATATTINSGGLTVTAGNLSFTAASDIVIAAATAAALEVSDGTTKFYAVDTRVTTVGVKTHTFDISDYTLASAAAAVATGVSVAAHTLTYSGTTQVTTQVDTVNIGTRTIVGGSAVTVDQANTLVAVAPTESTNVTLTAASALRIENAGGTPTNQYGIYIEDMTVGATADYGIYIAGADTAAIYVASADPIHLGVAGASTGKMEIDGATSGTVTVTVGATAGTWTLTLPGDDGDAGEQLQTNGSGVSSWEAAGSLPQFKNVIDGHDPQDALDKILNTRVVDFQYKEGRYDENGNRILSTGDHKTVYTGVLGDEAPWAMHHNGRIFNPTNAFGYSALAIQALYRRIEELESRLQGRKKALN